MAARLRRRRFLFPAVANGSTQRDRSAHKYGSAAWIAAALILVHEGTHARIQSVTRGYTHRRERDRVREERLCKEAELNFVQRLPDPGLLETKILNELSELAVVYSDSARARRSHENLVALRREIR